MKAINFGFVITFIVLLMYVSFLYGLTVGYNTDNIVVEVPISQMFETNHYYFDDYRNTTLLVCNCTSDTIMYTNFGYIPDKSPTKMCEDLRYNLNMNYTRN